MNLNLSLEVYTFFVFIFVGIIISIVFDVFRTFRMRKIYSDRMVAMQDILFWLITAVIVSGAIILFLKEKLRLYIFIAMFLGSIIYMLYFSRYIILLFNFIFKYIEKVINFIFVPFKFLYKIVEKTVKTCCIRIKNMIFYIHKRVTNVKIKKGFIYEKRKKQKL